MPMTEKDYKDSDKEFQEYWNSGMARLFYVLKDLDKIKEMLQDDYAHGDFFATPERIKEFRLAMRLFISDWRNNQSRLRRFGLDA